MDDIDGLIASVGDPKAYDFENCETRQDRMSPYNKQDVVAAILCTLGNFSQMGLLLNRNRSRVRDYVLGRVDVKAVWDSVREGAIDEIEHNTIVSAMAGDPTDRRFILTTLGKNRGYTTRSEVGGKDGEPIGVQVDLSGASTDSIKAAIAALKAVVPSGDNR